MTDTLTYNLANQLLSESFSGGVLSGLSVTNGFDVDLRRTTMAAQYSTTPLLQQSFGFDAASRLSSVSDGNNNSATYSYLANSPLVSQITFKQGSATRMTTSKQYDYLNRLTQISSTPGASGLGPLTYNYNYNPANQRTKDTLVDGSYWLYGYDSLGQVTNGCKYFSDGTPVAGQQFDYTFDTIGNRTQTMSDGDQNGQNLRVANYTPNNLNQITQRDVPGTNDVVGASLAWGVSVNGSPAYQKSEYYQGTVGTNNASGAAWLTAVVTNTAGFSNTGHVYVAKEPEAFHYDLDGNLTSDGRWTYTWDGENRLIKMAVNTTRVGPQYVLTFAYDARGRRIQKTVVTNNVTIYTDDFLYDGWNLLAVLGPHSSVLQSFMWGNDLSGTMQGAGGVGGLLEMSYCGTPTTNCFPAFDGNGNVMALVNAADGSLAADYDYGPFGEVIRATGPMAKVNPVRFSTKYQDDESDLLYFGFRYYKPSTGTWLQRDPLQEAAGANLYSYVDNSGNSSFDWLGCLTYRFHVVVGWGDVWTSPAHDGYGSYITGDNFASSSVTLFNVPPAHSGFCNTVWSWGSLAGNAGEIDVYAKDPCGGTFNIIGLYTAQVSGYGPKGGYGEAYLYSATGKMLSAISASPPQHAPNNYQTSVSACVPIFEQVTLSPGKEQMVLQYVPSLSEGWGPFTTSTVSGSVTLSN